MLFLFVGLILAGLRCCLASGFVLASGGGDAGPLEALPTDL